MPHDDAQKAHTQATENGDMSPSVEDYLRATAKAFGLGPDAAVAHLDQTLARNREKKLRSDITGETEALAQRLADESFRHSWDTSDEQKIDGAWVAGLCCECGEFVPYGSEVEHVAAAFAALLAGEALQCNHWLVGAKVGIPQMYDLRCLREPHDDGKHVCGSTDWNDSAGEYRA